MAAWTAVRKFKDVFDTVASTVDEAASLPQHQERPVEPLVVTALSNRGEVQVTVADAKVRSLMLQDHWFEVVTSDEAADLITATINEALLEWKKAQLEAVQSINPDMKELSRHFPGA